MAHEMDDIFLEQYEHEITDEPADPVRRRASVHRGAAYLQDIDYPPWGSSSGEQGEAQMAQEDEVLGSDYAHGLDILGAAKKFARPKAAPRAAFVAKKGPTGAVRTTLVLNKPKSGDNKATVKNAKTAGERAVSVGNKLLARAASAAKTAIHGVSKPAPRKPGKTTVKRGPSAANIALVKKVATAVKKSGEDLLKVAKQHEDRTKVNQQRAKSAASIIGGEDDYNYDAETEHAKYSVLGDMYDVLGEEAQIEAVEEYCGEDEASVDMAVVDMPVDAGAAGPPDYGMGPVPTLATLEPPLATPSPGTMTQIFYMSDPNTVCGQPISSLNLPKGDKKHPAITIPPAQSIPEGAVWFDGSQMPPKESIGSWAYFYGTPPKKNGIIKRGNWDERKNGNWHNKINFKFNVGSSPANATLYSYAQGWGPIVGAATDKVSWTKGLNYDLSSDRFFWYRSDAPAWALAVIDNERLNQAIVDYKAAKTAAQTDYAAAVAQAKLEAQESAAVTKQQAAEDAAQQRQLDKENVQVSHEADIQAKADEAAANQQRLADEATARQAQAATSTESDAYARIQQADAEAQAKLIEAQAAAAAQYAPQGYQPEYAQQGYAPQGYAPQGYAPQYAPQQEYYDDGGLDAMPEYDDMADQGDGGMDYDGGAGADDDSNYDGGEGPDAGGNDE